MGSTGSRTKLEIIFPSLLALFCCIWGNIRLHLQLRYLSRKRMGWWSVNPNLWTSTAKAFIWTTKYSKLWASPYISETNVSPKLLSDTMQKVCPKGANPDWFKEWLLLPDNFSVCVVMFARLFCSELHLCSWRNIWRAVDSVTTQWVWGNGAN